RVIRMGVQPGHDTLVSLLDRCERIVQRCPSDVLISPRCAANRKIEASRKSQRTGCLPSPSTISQSINRLSRLRLLNACAISSRRPATGRPSDLGDLRFIWTGAGKTVHRPMIFGPEFSKRKELGDQRIHTWCQQATGGFPAAQKPRDVHRSNAVI